jgi:NAD(P)-dependent dehydrogenase (short-subunit alcohol dehydrogenase family)
VAGRLAGKVAIVGGAGSSGPGFGSGKAISVLFALEGARVLLLDRVEERAAETLELVREAGGEAAVCTGDVTVGADCEAAVAEAVQRFGGLDVLVNNVGVPGPGDTIAALDEEYWDAQIAVNLKAMVLMSRAAIPALRSRGGGAILNIGSTGSVRPNGGHAAYDVAKGAVISLTIETAVEEGRNGIRVNCIQPGRMVTPLVGGAGSGPADEARMLNRSRNLLGILGDAWDVAWAAVFLASDEARWITSVTLPVDAGFLHSPPELEGVRGAQLRDYLPYDRGQRG